ncbi:AP endonuclease [Chryseobacterium sp. 6424]|nr:AP endonuclease [Chryseobacterium sp. 6424]
MRLFRFLFTVFHFTVVALLAGTALNAYVPPKVFAWMNMLSLAFPFLLIIHTVLCMMWLVLWKKRAFIFLAATLLFYYPAKRWINFTAPAEGEVADFKVLTMNIKGAAYGKETLYSYLKNSNADVILVQEYAKNLKNTDYPNTVQSYSIVGLASKTKVIEHQRIETSSNGESFYADIEIKGRTVRFINMYLNPFAFDKNKVKPSEDYEKNKRKVRYIAGTLIPTFKIHQDEVAAIRKAVLDSPYPVVLAGDFNAVPSSYEYYQLSDVLHDAFLTAGNGLSTSFHDYKFPIRIDYIFSSKDLKPISYWVDRHEKMSDHYPVIATFKFEK